MDCSASHNFQRMKLFVCGTGACMHACMLRLLHILALTHVKELDAKRLPLPKLPPPCADSTLAIDLVSGLTWT